MRARYHDDKLIGELCARQPILAWTAVFMFVLYMPLYVLQVSDSMFAKVQNI